MELLCLDLQFIGQKYNLHEPTNQLVTLFYVKLTRIILLFIIPRTLHVIVFFYFGAVATFKAQEVYLF